MAKVSKQEKLEKLYSLAMSTTESPPPKQAFLSWKCPKCGSKLEKESANDYLIAWKGQNQFANRVVSDAGLKLGTHYKLSIDKFSCKCGYEYAERTLEEVTFSADD